MKHFLKGIYIDSFKNTGIPDMDLGMKVLGLIAWIVTINLIVFIGLAISSILVSWPWMFKY